MNATRRQLTLFVDDNHSAPIEDIRKRFNPAQYRLIKTHVTLCREDELEEYQILLQNLTQLNHHVITISFGEITRFPDGKGVLIPSIGDKKPFRELRKRVLKGISDNPREYEAHITLMHPRNSICSDHIFEQIKNASLPKQFMFQAISLVEQISDGPWNTLRTFGLKHNLEESNRT